MADELAGLPQNIAPWFPPAESGSNAAAEDQAFQREMVPYSLLLARAGQYLPMGDLSGVAPSENIIYDTVDPFERAAARVRAPYVAAAERASAVQEGPFDRLRNEARQSIADDYARAMGVGAGDPFERAASRLRAPYAQANARVSGLPDVATMLANKVAGIATSPRDALTGAMQVTDPMTGMIAPEALQRAQQFASAAMTGAMPFAQRGAAGMGGGKLLSYEQWLAKNNMKDSSKAALEYQTEMEGEGPTTSVGGREASNLMYPDKPTFHDALIQTGHKYEVIKGADGRIYHSYTKGGGQFAGSGIPNK